MAKLLIEVDFEKTRELHVDMLLQNHEKNTQLDLVKNFSKKDKKDKKKKKKRGALDIVVESGGLGDKVKRHGEEYTPIFAEDEIIDFNDKKNGSEKIEEEEKDVVGVVEEENMLKLQAKKMKLRPKWSLVRKD